jgi:hypothetical protein
VPDFIRDSEPVLDGEVLDALTFDACLFGHYHKQGRVSERCWLIGPPMRPSFNEANLAPGFLEVEWDEVEPCEAHVRHVEIPDRALVTIDLDEVKPATTSDYRGSVVRLRYTTTPERAVGRSTEAKLMVDQLLADGALKVIVEGAVERPEREQRAEGVSADTDPLEALDTWMDQNDVDERLRPDVRAAAKEVIGGSR